MITWQSSYSSLPHNWSIISIYLIKQALALFINIAQHFYTKLHYHTLRTFENTERYTKSCGFDSSSSGISGELVLKRLLYKTKKTKDKGWVGKCKNKNKISKIKMSPAGKFFECGNEI